MRTWITGQKIAAQGEITIVKLDELTPEEVASLDIPDVDHEVTGAQLIVGHSETGHHHVMDSTHARMWEMANPLMARLEIDGPTELRHLRTWHTHETWRLPAGKYHITRQRERSPEGWKRVED